MSEDREDNSSFEPLLDVLIVGAGISGISAACHLQVQCPDKRYLILEAREQLGGTWDLFRYPGIRSDSDMHTFGFKFRPWTNAKVLADGPSILTYLQESVDEYRVGDKILYGRKVTSASWDSDRDRWTVTTLNDDGIVQQFNTRLLFMCSGYYNYESGYTPQFEGIENFHGQVIHPQKWPEQLEYQDKRIVVIGSGATAVTLVPAMADSAARVTMIQRSPTYVVSRPGRDRLANLLNKLLPEKWAYAITRWRNIRFQNYIYRRARSKPEKFKNTLIKMVRKELGDDYDVATHFTPSYDPWTQRLCLVPDADLFDAIKQGKADVVTGEIDCITATGVRMNSGEEVDADILVTATGLRLQILGGVEFFMDGEKVDFSKHFCYQGMMVSNVPNLVQTFGYINASWTLRADLNSQFVCAMLEQMDAREATRCVAVLKESDRTMSDQDWVTGFNPGYMQRSMHLFPRQGDHAPWLNTQNYLLDKKSLGKGPGDDGVLTYS